MKCPECDGRMIEQTTMGVTVDQCEECGGVWFNQGELRPYLQRLRSSKEHSVPSDAELQLAEIGEATLCPECGRPSFRTGVYRRQKFSVCGSCRGIFLSESSIRRLLDDSQTKRLEELQLDDFLWMLDV